MIHWGDMTDSQTILLVEDEAIMRDALKGALETAGFTVIPAEDGEQGLKAALESHPALILSDLQMPKMGGLEMIRQIRADAWGKTSKIIILTNISDVTALEAAMAEGTFHYLVKSDASMEEVVAKVKSRLSEVV